MSALERSTVTTAQVALNASAATQVFTAGDRRFAEIKNLDTSIVVYLGSTSALTSATGYSLAAGATFALDNFIGTIYAIAASGTPSVAVIMW